MSYLNFIDNLEADDKVLVYSTKTGMVLETTVALRNEDASIILRAEAIPSETGLFFSDKGNGVLYATGNKIMPHDQDIYNALFAAEHILTVAELEALVI